MTTTPNPIQTQDPTPAPAPDTSAAPVAAPVTPVPAAPAAPALDPALQAQLAPLAAKMNSQLQAASDSANAPAPPPPPHQRLMNMIAGLGAGLSGFGSAIATHGEKGGAAEVQEIMGARQQQQIEAQQAALAKKNAETQQQLMAAGITEKQMQNIMLLHAIPNDMAKSDLERQKLGEEVAGEQQRQAVVGAEFSKANWGLTPDQVSGKTPLTQQNLSTSQSMLNRAIGNDQLGAMAILGKDNPAVVEAQRVAGSATPTAQEISAAGQGLIVAQQQSKETTAAKTAQEAAAANNPVAKLSTPEALAAPGAQASIQAKIDDPNTDSKDVPRLRALLPQAAVAQFNAETIKQREARNQQVINQGSADAAGRELANRTLTLDELKSRNVTPDFIVSAVTAAQKYDKTFKAPEAAAQARIAASPANSQFFGNTDSLLVKGGTLDQLATAYGALGNTKIPAINKLDNLRKAAVGSGPLAAAYAAQLGVADDYSKVISGGGGSDSSRQQALDIMSVNLSPEGQAAGIAQIRKTIESQRNGRVSTNPYMQDMYPDPSTRQETPGLSGTQPASSVAPISKFTADTVQPARTTKVPAGFIHGNGPHGAGWYDPSTFGGR